MLAIRCQFLQGTYQAAQPGAPSEREWPPHPGRLQAALVAAGWSVSDDGFDAGALQALRWVEDLGPPALALPEKAAERTAPTVYVPRNLSRTESTSIRSHLRAQPPRITAATRESGRVDRTFPTTVVGDEPVWFIWAAAEPSPDVHETLSVLVESVQYLGSSRSPVCCKVVEDPPAPTLVPSSRGLGAGLRIATPGMTESLVASRGMSTVETLMPTATYAYPASVAASIEAGPFTPPVVLRRTAGFGLTVAHCGTLAYAFRRAVLSQAGDDAPAVLHGHGCNPHAAFVPLPNVGHAHSSGEILGFGLILPAGTEEDDQSIAVAAARAVTTLKFDRAAAPWSLMPSVDSPLKTLQPATWAGPSRRWRTATPIVLDRHPRRSRGETIEGMLRLSFVNAGYPEPIELRVSRQPFLAGSIAGLQQANGKLKESGMPVHCDARFQEPVRGPMIVGRGRYMGVGLLKPDRGRGGR